MLYIIQLDFVFRYFKFYYLNYFKFLRIQIFFLELYLRDTIKYIYILTTLIFFKKISMKKKL